MFFWNILTIILVLDVLIFVEYLFRFVSFFLWRRGIASPSICATMESYHAHYITTVKNGRSFFKDDAQPNNLNNAISLDPKVMPVFLNCICLVDVYSLTHVFIKSLGPRIRLLGSAV